MIIYGVTLLSLSMLIGVVVGQLIGQLLGLDANVGGVGLAMLILVFAVDWLKRHERLDDNTQAGMTFWSGIYIPIVVAMAAHQNVVGALQGGPAAITAGLLATIGCFALVPVISRIGYRQRQHEATHRPVDSSP